VGHKKAQCRKLKKEQAEKMEKSHYTQDDKDEDFDYVWKEYRRRKKMHQDTHTDTDEDAYVITDQALAAQVDGHPRRWIFDTGATASMTCTKPTFHYRKLKKGTRRVQVGGGHVLNVKGIGTMIFIIPTENGTTSVRIDDILYVPDLGCNLCSFRHLEQKHGATMVSTKGMIMTTFNNGKNVVSRNNGKLYLMEWRALTKQDPHWENHARKRGLLKARHSESLAAALQATDVKIEWRPNPTCKSHTTVQRVHRRLGHASLRVMQQHVQEKLVDTVRQTQLAV